MTFACRAPEPTAKATAGRGPVGSAVAPSLEDVFLRPGLLGEPPRIEALSADGRWLLFEHRSLARGDDGRLVLERGPGLRLLEVDGEAAPWRNAPTVAGLLPAPVDDARRAGDDEDGGGTDDEERDDRARAARDPAGDVRAAWSPAGHRLLVARGKELFLYDPGSSRLRLLVDPAEAPWKRLRSIAFERDGGSLRASDGRGAWRLVLPPSGWPAATTPADELLRLAPPALVPDRELSWSDDRRVAFAAAGVLRRDAPLPGWRVLARRVLPHQVAHFEAGRLARVVELAGLAAMKWCEHLALSPDGSFVVGFELDRRRDPPPTLVPDYLTTRVSQRKARAMWADDGPTPARLWVWDTDTGAASELALPRFDGPLGDPLHVGADVWLAPLGWAPQAEPPVPGSVAPGPDAPGSDAGPFESAPDPSAAARAGALAPARYAFLRRSADHRRLEVWCWSAGELRRLWSEEDERWAGGPVSARRWTPDGRLLVLGSESTALSTTPGRAQLFALDAETGAVRQLTEVAGEVAGFEVLHDGSLVVESSDAEPARRRLGWLSAAAVRGDAEPELVALEQPEGWNQDAAVGAELGPRRAADAPPRAVFLHEELGRPAEIWVADAGGARQLTDTLPDAYRAVDWIRPVLFRGATTEDGRPLSAHVFLPRGVELPPPGARTGATRATIVFVHGAGYLQNVADSMTQYPLNLMFHSRLAALGYVVVDVDYRGSRGYGSRFRTDVQYHLGGTDLDDIHAVLDALIERGLVDPERVGLYGGSYGGFLTMMALFTAPERWRVGAALRSVTDWRTYSPWYTQPRLGRPSTHPEAYRRSSPIDHVPGLAAPLLVLHGMVDDNVFAQDSIRLIEELIRLGKDFDAMLYPSQSHAFASGEHWLDEYRRIEAFLLRHLGPPGAPDAVTRSAPKDRAERMEPGASAR